MPIKKSAGTLLLLFSAVSSGSASYEQRDLFELTLEELLNVRVVSSVSGEEQELKSAPASATIIEANEWQRRGAKTLHQAIVGVPGLQSTILNSLNHERNVVVRGLAGNFGEYVKLLIDGVPINRVHHGGKPGLDIPLLGFKRIEIVRSPGSATYGADAFAGIINLVSNDDEALATKVSVSAGAFDDYDMGIMGRAQSKDVNFIYALNLSKFGDDPDRLIARDSQTPLDTIFATQASRAPASLDHSYHSASVNLKAKWQDLSISYYALTGTFGLGAGVAEALDPDNEGKHRTQILDTKYQFSMFGEDTTTANLWLQKKHTAFDYTIFPAGTRLPIGQDGNLNFSEPSSVALFEDGYIGHPSSDSELGQVNLTQVIRLPHGHNLRWQTGFEHHNHTPYEQKNFGPGVLKGTETQVSGELTDVSGTPYAYLPEKSRQIYFLSIQDTWQINDDWSLHLGGRYDDYSDFGSTYNPRLGVVWQAAQQVTVKLLSAKAFRAPSFFGQHAVNNPINLGNPDLKPEFIQTHEFNVSINPTEHLFMALSYYQYHARDIVEYIEMPGMTGRKATNQGSIDGNGVEWNLQWRPNNQFDLTANVSFVNNEDENKQTLADVAERMASVNANYDWRDIMQFNLFWQYQGEQQRAVGDSRPALSSATWTSAKVSYQFASDNGQLSLVINNLFDQNNRTPSSSIEGDYPIAGRQWLLQFDYQF